MKQLRILFALLLGVVMGACSDDAPYHDGEIDVDFINHLSRDGSVSTYKCQSYKLFDKSPYKNSKDWEEVDWSDLIGHSSSLSFILCLQDGKIWEPADIFPYSCPASISVVWNAYKRRTVKKTELYICSKFEYDENMATMKIGGYDCKVHEFTDKSLRLSLETVGWNGAGEPWPSLEVFDYVITTPKHFDGENLIGFDSERECYLYILEVARNLFGRYINLNEVYAGAVVFDEPIIDLDSVEASIIGQEQK